MAGWGKTELPFKKAFKRVLLDVSVPIKDWQSCKIKWQKEGRNVNKGHICAGAYYKDSCQVSRKIETFRLV